MQLEEYFLCTLKDLRERIVRNKHDIDYEYCLLKAAALLRLLLMDSEPLIHLVNRLHRTKVLFEVVTRTTVPGITFWQAGDMLDPASYKLVYDDDSQIQSVTLDKFLAIPVIAAGSHIMSICDAISFYANKEGGVHRGWQLTKPELQWFRDIEKQVVIDGCPPGLMMIAVIGRIVLSALSGLEQTIIGNHELAPKSHLVHATSLINTEKTPLAQLSCIRLLKYLRIICKKCLRYLWRRNYL